MIIPPSDAICGGMRQKQFVDFSGKFVLEWLPPTNIFPCFGLEILFQCHIVTTNKIEPKKENYNHHYNYSQLHLVLSFRKVD